MSGRLVPAQRTCALLSSETIEEHSGSASTTETRAQSKSARGMDVRAMASLASEQRYGSGVG
eukprot:2035592-Pyramimonas_sp.AAC.1